MFFSIAFSNYKIQKTLDFVGVPKIQNTNTVFKILSKYMTFEIILQNTLQNTSGTINVAFCILYLYSSDSILHIPGEKQEDCMSEQQKGYSMVSLCEF
jgi:hypothetical protein